MHTMVKVVQGLASTTSRVVYLLRAKVGKLDHGKVLAWVGHAEISKGTALA